MLTQQFEGGVMPGVLKTRNLAVGCLAGLAALQCVAQSAPAAAKTRGAGGVGWVQKKIKFAEGKPVLGLPAEGTRTHPRCSNDGTMFFDVYTHDASPTRMGAPELYSVTSAGEVKRLSQKLPVDFTSMSVIDFFAADHTLVTLLRAERDEDGTTPAPPREVRYFLSLSDYDGDGADLLSLELKFRPLKVALFGNGDFLVLGWDDANQLPVMATLKEDGEVRRFVDLDNKHPTLPYGNYDSLKEMEASAQAHVNLEMLEHAAFVPFGSQVLLTYPGTARFIRVLGPVGEDRAIPIQLPGGFVLHDVLVSGVRYSLVLRAEQPEDAQDPRGQSQDARMKMFEMNSNNGSLLREFLFDRPHIGEVACSPDSRLMAVFEDTMADVVQQSTAASDKAAPAESATQLVIATAPR
jgi:hypothetical protein